MLLRPHAHYIYIHIQGSMSSKILRHERIKEGFIPAYLGQSYSPKRTILHVRSYSNGGLLTLKGNGGVYGVASNMVASSVPWRNFCFPSIAS